MATITFLATGVSKNWSDPTAWDLGRIPNENDDVVFSTNVASSVLVIDGTATTPSKCKSINTTGYTRTITHATGTYIAVYGSWTFTTGLTYVPAGTATVIFASTSTGQTITWAGYHAPTTMFDGVGGGWTFQDAMNATGANIVLYLYRGALNTNNQQVGAAASRVDMYSDGSPVSNTRSLTLGTTTWYIGANTLAWTIANPTGMTMSAASATIKTTNSALTFSGGGFTYGSLISNTTTIHSTVTINGANTFGTFDIGFQAAATNQLIFSASQTVSTLLAIRGNSQVNRTFVKSQVPGTVITLTSNGTNTVTSADFQDTTGAGSASWNLSAITGLSGDCGGNSGITFTTAITCYYKSGVSGGFNNGSVWFTTSGGSTASRMPLPQDTIRVDGSSITVASITLNLDIIRAGNIDFTGCTNTPNFIGTTTCAIFGNITYGGNMTSTGTGQLYWSGRGTQTFNSNGITILRPFVIDTGTGTVQLSGNLTHTAGITVNSGNLTPGAYTVTGAAFTQNGGATSLGAAWSCSGLMQCLGGTFAQNGFAVTASAALTSTNTTYTTGAGTLAVTGALTVSGTGSFTSGTGLISASSSILVTNSANFTTGSGGSSSTQFNPQGSGTITFGGAHVSSGSFNQQGGCTVNTNGQTISCTTFANAGGITNVNSVITMTGALSCSSTGQIICTGSGAFTGGTSFTCAGNTLSTVSGTFSTTVAVQTTISATNTNGGLTTGPAGFTCAGITVNSGFLTISSTNATTTSMAHVNGTIIIIGTLTGSSTWTTTNGTLDGLTNSGTITGFTAMTFGGTAVTPVYSVYNLTCSGILTIATGTTLINFTAGGGTINCLTCVNNSTGVRTVNMGSGTWNVSGATAWTWTSVGMTFIAGTATINMTTGSSQVFTGGGPTYNKVTTCGGSGSIFTFTGAQNFNILYIADVSTCYFTSGATYTIALLQQPVSVSANVFNPTSTTNYFFNLGAVNTVHQYPGSLNIINCTINYKQGASYYFANSSYGTGSIGFSIASGPGTVTALTGGGNWSNPAIWSNSSEPQPADSVVFPSGISGTYNINGTSGVPNKCRSLTMTGFTATLLQPTTTYLVVGDATAGNIVFASTGTYTANTGAFLLLVSTASGNTLTTNGKLMPGTIQLLGTGAWQLQDTLIGAAGTCTITHSFGSLDTNGKTIGSAGSPIGYSSTNGNVRSLTLGATTWNLPSSAWIVQNSTNMTFNAGTSNLVCNAQASCTIYHDGGVFYNVSITNATSQIIVCAVNVNVSGQAMSFNNLTLSTTGLTDCPIYLNANMTVAGNLSVAGSASGYAYRGRFGNIGMVGTPRTITVTGTVTITNVDIVDLTAGGSGWDLSGNTSSSTPGDQGGNSNITFAPSQTIYFKGSGAINWWLSAGIWFTTSGGTVGARNPLPQDDVVFDANSITAVGTIITFATGARACRTLTMTGVTNLPTFTFTGGSAFYGSVVLPGPSNLIVTGAAALTLAGRGTNTLTTNGATLTCSINFIGFGGTLSLADDLSCVSISTTQGTFYQNGKNMTFTSSFSISGTGIFVMSSDWSSSAQPINVGGGTLDMNGYNITNPLTISLSGTILLSGTMSVQTINMNGGGRIIGNGTLNVAGNLVMNTNAIVDVGILTCTGTGTVNLNTGCDLNIRTSGSWVSLVFAGTGVAGGSGLSNQTINGMTVTPAVGGSGPVSYGYAG